MNNIFPGTSMTGPRPAEPLTLFWKLMVTLAAVLGETRLLASYESMTYYAAPGTTSGVVCLVGKYAWDEASYWEACDYLRDGRDPVAEVQDPDDRDILFVPDQFDHGPLERQGWVTLHRNLLIQPLVEPPQPPEPATRNASLQKNG